MEKQYYQINEELARSAKQSFSFSDYVSNSATAEYEGQVDYAWELVDQRKAKGDLTPAQVSKLEDYADRYARRLAKWKNSYNSNVARCPSVMIVGSSNFPVHKKEKQNAREGKLLEEYKDIEKYLKWIKDFSISTAIKAGDADAIQQLEKKLQSLLDTQEEMKAANAYYRKNKTMKGYKDMTDEQAAAADESIKNGYSWQQQPYPSYKLTNNNGSIKQTRDRLEILKREKSSANLEYNTAGLSMRIEENKEIMRLQVFFDEKPDSDARQVLKSHGFIYAPSHGAWQRQLTDNARRAMNKVIFGLTQLQDDNS